VKKSIEAYCHHLCFDGCFPCAPGLAGSSSVFFLHLFWKRSFGISGTGFFCELDALPVSQPAVSDHWRKVKALIPTAENHGLTSSFIHPPLDSWRNGGKFFLRWLSSLYTGCPLPYPKWTRRSCCCRELLHDAGHLYRKLVPNSRAIEWIETTLKLLANVGKLSQNHFRSASVKDWCMLRHGIHGTPWPKFTKFG